MTILNAPAPSRPGTSTRPVPWRRLAWVSWRQYRFSAAGAAVFLGVVAAYLLIVGLRVRSGYASLGSCHLTESHISQTCTTALMLFGGYHVWGETTAAFMLAVPVLVGVFAGAPVLGRELEAGTFRFAWTQGAGRTRWTLARLAVPAVAVTAAAAALSQLFGWFYYPFFAFPADSAFAPQYFELTGIAFAAWTLAAFAIGGLAGVLVRKVVPAIAAAMAAWAGLLLVTILYLRPHYEAALTAHGSGGAPGKSPWVIHQWWVGPNGQAITSENKIIQLINRPQRGYTQWTIYQPEARYWHFQFIEAGWLLVLSLLLIAGTIWVVRRRAA
ncbi:MAG TPA: ABC transporter permease subunit [Streptosporangiaceae bacterium]|nr:ABC transporter permease subunit [Streptosporangiaceae bacterium]